MGIREHWLTVVFSVTLSKDVRSGTGVRELVVLTERNQRSVPIGRHIVSAYEEIRPRQLAPAGAKRERVYTPPPTTKDQDE